MTTDEMLELQKKVRDAYKAGLVGISNYNLHVTVDLFKQFLDSDETPRCSKNGKSFWLSVNRDGIEVGTLV